MLGVLLVASSVSVTIVLGLVVARVALSLMLAVVQGEPRQAG
jgi:hypothetical protein